MLAQLTPEMVVGIPAAIISLGALLWLWNQAKEAWGGLKGEPANEQLHLSQKEIERRVQKLEDNIVGKEWFEKVDTALLELKHTAHEQSEKRDAQIQDLSKQIDRTPERVLSLLRNVKELGGHHD